MHYTLYKEPGLAGKPSRLLPLHAMLPGSSWSVSPLAHQLQDVGTLPCLLAVLWSKKSAGAEYLTGRGRGSGGKGAGLVGMDQRGGACGCRGAPSGAGAMLPAGQAHGRASHRD